MSNTDYGAIVIGAGPGGYPCAIRLGQLGVKTLIVEKEYWGGVCLNVGCIPSKAMITAAKHFEDMHHAADFGIEVSGDITMNATALQAFKNRVVKRLTGGVSTLLKGNKVEQAFGTATVTGPNTVEIDSEEGKKTFTAEHIVIATGSSPIQIPGFEFADERILDSTGALELDEIPKRMVVIGGGYIGLEMGGMFSKLGTEVTIVEMMDQILPGFDSDVTKVLARQLKKQKVKTLLKTKALGWEAADDGIIVNVETPKGKQSIEADYVLVTVGRRPNTRGVADALNLEMDGPFFKADDQRRTSVRNVFAIGDVACQPMLAHKATHEGEIVAEVIAGHDVKIDYKTVPAVVFTDPEVATAGMDESTARAHGEILVGKVPFAAVGRAVTANETDGFYKVIIDKKTKLILGVTIVGYHASDLISEAGLAIEMSAEALDIGLTIHPHPTLGEGVMEAAKAALGEAIHILN
ncbi:MAG: dihydrolipoamide dehydrogenase [Myxococcota bacterium]|jgi:dihydrolipoamide dehydrogenase